MIEIKDKYVSTKGIRCISPVREKYLDKEYTEFINFGMEIKYNDGYELYISMSDYNEYCKYAEKIIEFIKGDEE